MVAFYKTSLGQARSDPAKALRTQLCWLQQDARRGSTRLGSVHPHRVKTPVPLSGCSPSSPYLRDQGAVETTVRLASRPHSDNFVSLSHAA